MTTRGLLLWAILLVSPIVISAQYTPATPSWNRPVEPFRMIGNIYYIGASDITSYLIKTNDGLILIDGGFRETAPQILANIRKLGFRTEDVKYLLNSHAHFDHAGGFHELQRVTHAKLAVMEQDAALIKRGGHDDPGFGDRFLFPPAKPDIILHDGDNVSLGGTTLHAMRTGGHTKGCTSWTTTVDEAGREYNVVFVCSTNALDFKLVNNPKYPEIADDFRASFKRLLSTPCDVFLGSHGNFYDLDAKAARARNGDHFAFIDPDGYRRFVEHTQSEFEAKYARQTAGTKP